MADVVTASDGLPARVIKPHTVEKFDRHEKYCGIFTSGMSSKWANDSGSKGSRLGYLELFAGPGRAMLNGNEVDGCPLITARPDTLFNRLAFVEFDAELAAALEQRLRARGLGPERALVLQGDANDDAVLEEAMRFLPVPGLIFAFVDPEDINSSWSAIQFLAGRLGKGQRVDFLLNFPVGPMKRNFASDEKITRALGTDAWKARVDAGEPLGFVFRETLQQQFKRMEFEVAEHMEVRAHGSETPVYDLVFASRNPRGIDFWKKIQKIGPEGQYTLF